MQYINIIKIIVFMLIIYTAWFLATDLSIYLTNKAQAKSKKLRKPKAKQDKIVLVDPGNP